MAPGRLGYGTDDRASGHVDTAGAQGGVVVTWVWIVVAVVVIGAIVGLWVANAARLAKRNGQLGRRSPTRGERAARVERGEDDR